jgi:hypothetical protein
MTIEGKVLKRGECREKYSRVVIDSRLHQVSSSFHAAVVRIEAGVFQAALWSLSLREKGNNSLSPG